MPISGKKHNPIYQAQAILARRDHAEREVRQKLSRKHFSQEQIQQAIDWLYNNRLLDDARFAHAYSESILLAKPVGPAWLKAKLRAKGVGQKDIEAVVESVFSQHPQEELIRQATESWKRSHAAKANDKAALWRFLASRGFSPGSITKSLEAS